MWLLCGDFAWHFFLFPSPLLRKSFRDKSLPRPKSWNWRPPWPVLPPSLDPKTLDGRSSEGRWLLRKTTFWEWPAIYFHYGVYMFFKQKLWGSNLTPNIWTLLFAGTLSWAYQLGSCSHANSRGLVHHPPAHQSWNRLLLWLLNLFVHRSFFLHKALIIYWSVKPQPTPLS